MLLTYNVSTDTVFTDAVRICVTYNSGCEKQFETNDLLCRILYLYVYARVCA